jgi:hypothetical protein
MSTTSDPGPPAQSIFDVLGFQRLSQQGIFLQIQHAQDQIIAGPPERVGLAQLFSAERSAWHGRARIAECAQRQWGMDFSHYGG